MTFDFEWAELPDDIAQAKQQAWQQWELLDHQLHDPVHPPAPDQVEALERNQRVVWKQYWHADGARYHLSNRQMSDAITVMERSGMTRQVPTPPFPQPATYGTSDDEYDAWLDATDRGQTPQPTPALAAYLEARDQHLQANYDARVIPRAQAMDQRRLAHHPRGAGRRPPPRPPISGGPPPTAHPLVAPMARLPRRRPQPRRRPRPLTTAIPAPLMPAALMEKGRRCTTTGSPSPT